MIKRLGANLQDALIKIKGDLQSETKDTYSALEDKLNQAVVLITEDTNRFGQKWDQELQKFQIYVNKKVEDNESNQ